MQRRALHPRRLGRIAGLATLTLVACTYRHYFGPPLPPSERSVVEGDSSFYLVAAEGIRITSVENKRVSEFAKRLELPPGYHYLYANYEAFYVAFGESGSQDCLIEFEAVAAHDYRIDYKTKRDDTWSAWLTDTTTGERIADCRFTTTPVQSWTPRPTHTPTPAS